MRKFVSLKEFADAQGTELGISDWFTINQERINVFADATDDHQWIHTDPERTRTELDMDTIAHGFLTLSLVPKFMFEVFEIEGISRIFNYGCNKVRFIHIVSVGSEIRARVFLKRAVLSQGSLRTIAEITFEIKGVEKPALIAEVITLFYE